MFPNSNNVENIFSSVLKFSVVSLSFKYPHYFLIQLFFEFKTDFISFSLLLGFRLTQGVVKRIIPAVASTNAVIAATCAMEVFKVATSCANPLQNYMIFNDSDGIYTYAYEASRNEECLACSQKARNITMSR